jgi:hypothetical protein
MKLTGAAILVSRGMTVLHAAPAAYTYRSAGAEGAAMATCSQCGKETSFWERDLFTGACPSCRATGARPATLGCGTLLLIGIVVAIFSRPGVGDLETRVSGLRTSVEDLKKASDAQTSEIRELRKAVEDLRKGGGGPGK